VHIGAALLDDRPVTLVEVGQLVGLAAQGKRVRGEVGGTVAVAEHQWAATAGRDQAAVVASEQHAERVGATQPPEGRVHRALLGHAVFEIVGDQVRDHLGVGLAAEAVASGLELPTQFAEVLDDAVVHHRDPLGGMRVGVVGGRCAVRRPAGVGDAVATVQRCTVEQLLQVVELALRTAFLQLPVAYHGDARGVVAAILEAAQAGEQVGDDGVAVNESDDSAHVRYLQVSGVFRRLHARGVPASSG
jgi:hypothetical protein